MRVVASGRLKPRSYEKDGAKQTVIEFEIDEIGPSLRFANAKVNRTQRNNSGGFGGQQQPAMAAAAPQADPWGPAPSASNAVGWGSGPDGEPPF
jgi:single-strand DNA-binding protein